MNTAQSLQTACRGIRTAYKKISKIAGFILCAVLMNVVLMNSAPLAWANNNDTAHDGDYDNARIVSDNEMISTDKAAIDIGHVDIGPKIIDGQWKLLARDDSGDTPVWRYLDNVVFKVKDAAIMDAPQGEEYSVFGAHETDKWWVIPQTQNPDVVWLGWNTQDPQASGIMDRGGTLSLESASSDDRSSEINHGRAWVFVQDGTFGKPRILFDSQKKNRQDIWVDANTHVHANWVFTQPGIRLIPVKFCASTTTGETECASSVLRFAVGDSASTEEALNATVRVDEHSQDTTNDDSRETMRNDSRSQSGDHSKYSSSQQSQSHLVGIVLTCLCTIALIVVLGVVVVRARANKRNIIRASKEIEEEAEKESSKNIGHNNGWEGKQ
ncbi:hypothetical protein EJ419_04945 [Alloscardovia theropitheci]|uniref:Cell surface protein n=1 Tax=Alloscardovia theropitheci TaxID=2496842 RepID=A0A4R0QVT3_9BIFI|nr:choice-of-anchor M domain-containing protein [Alloscardovia theropitheci]TCD54377.1 hypothetical protein EJ419_04945 [Alloscardovia theropitheci]